MFSAGLQCSAMTSATPGFERVKSPEWPFVGRVDVNDGLGELCRRLLRQIVPYAAGNVAMLILADVLLGIDARVSMRCAVRVAFQCDRRTSDSWKCRDLLLQSIYRWYLGLEPGERK